MLITCPECQLPVSDKAVSCPHCGYPMIETAPIPKKRKNNKRKRLPNGFGQISEIKGRSLRKPFRAMVTVGKDKNGRPICKPLKPESYFETYNKAYEALIEYNKNPYDLDPAISVEELYNRWTESYFKTLKSESSIRTITSAWAYCSSVAKMRAMDVRARHIKGILDEGYKVVDNETIYPTAGIKARIKSMMNLMFDYAVEYEIVDRNYARTFTISDDIIEEKENAHRGHIPFSNEEMQILWDNAGKVLWTDVVIFQCYSGWRPQELGLIEIANINFDDWTIIGGIKTDAGRDRLVPIHTKVRDIVKAKYDEAVQLGSKYLFNCTDTQTYRSSLKLTYDKYQSRFGKVISQLHLNPEHRPHDGRMHFVTMAKKYNLDEYAIKYIVGHAIDDITEKVYTQREVSWLCTEIEKIK